MITRELLGDLGFTRADGYDHEVWVYTRDGEERFFVHFTAGNFEERYTPMGVRASISYQVPPRDFFVRLLDTLESYH